MSFSPVRLDGKLVYLEPMQMRHRGALQVAANHENIWTYMPTSGLGKHFDHWFDTALKEFANKTHFPFVIRNSKDNSFLGSTRLHDISPEHGHLTVGYTWFTPSVWGDTKMQAECMYLLLNHIFDVLKYHRVVFYSDARNVDTHKSLKQLGATLEGVSRNHMVLEDGSMRDSVVYTIIASEWSTIKQAIGNWLTS